MNLTSWELELQSDRLGIQKKNPLFDFDVEPERKRQKFVVQGPWWAPSSRTIGIVGRGRWIAISQQRKRTLRSPFNHWRQLAYAEFPKVNKRKMTSGLRQVAEEVRLFQEKEKIVLAAKRDLFAARLMKAYRKHFKVESEDE